MTLHACFNRSFLCMCLVWSWWSRLCVLGRVWLLPVSGLILSNRLISFAVSFFFWPNLISDDQVLSNFVICMFGLLFFRFHSVLLIIRFYLLLASWSKLQHLRYVTEGHGFPWSVLGYVKAVSYCKLRITMDMNFRGGRRFSVFGWGRERLFHLIANTSWSLVWIYVYFQSLWALSSVNLILSLSLSIYMHAFIKTKRIWINFLKVLVHVSQWALFSYC